jgi:hypothetical protein
MRRPIYAISIDGNDVSSNFNPVLIALTIHESDGGKADTLEIELDDTGGQIALPAMGVAVEASLGWSDSGAVVTFTGFIGDAKASGSGHSGGGEGHARHGRGGGGKGPHSGGDRHKGRTLTLTATSVDMRGNAKQHVEMHKDDSSFQDAATAFAGPAGLSVEVGGSLASIQRSYWWIGNESFLEWGARNARDLGATFKVFGKKAVFVPRSSGMSASGQPLVPIAATWGDNLISWSIAPILSRLDYAEYGARWYDLDKAKWNREAASASAGDGVTAKHTGNFKAATKTQATERANSSKAEGGREKGGADHVVIHGEPAAQAEATCNVSGVRPGVDGSYVISEVTHHLSRHEGFTTTLALKQPSGAAGSDSRDGASSDETAAVSPSGSYNPLSSGGAYSPGS